MTYAVVALTLAGSGWAQQAGDQVEGVIAEVDGRSLTVDREGGGKVTARLGARTQVVVQSRQGGNYPNPSTAFLKPGMGVRFKHADGPVDRVHVTSVPSGAWPEKGTREETRGGSARQRPAALTGRVVRVDQRAGRLTVEVAGREQSYSVEDPALIADVGQGDRIRFDVEERDGRSVIVAIH